MTPGQAQLLRLAGEDTGQLTGVMKLVYGHRARSVAVLDSSPGRKQGAVLVCKTRGAGRNRDRSPPAGAAAQSPAEGPGLWKPNLVTAEHARTQDRVPSRPTCQ